MQLEVDAARSLLLKAVVKIGNEVMSFRAEHNLNDVLQAMLHYWAKFQEVHFDKII